MCFILSDFTGSEMLGFPAPPSRNLSPMGQSEVGKKVSNTSCFRNSKDFSGHPASSEEIWAHILSLWCWDSHCLNLKPIQTSRFPKYSEHSAEAFKFVFRKVQIEVELELHVRKY